MHLNVVLEKKVVKGVQNLEEETYCSVLILRLMAIVYRKIRLKMFCLLKSLLDC